MIIIRSYKHLAVIKTVRNGTPTCSLLCRDRYLCEFFDHWAYGLAKNHRTNTVKAYAYAVADFLNYILELMIQHGGLLTRQLMLEALDSYESYLVFGVESSARMAASAAKVLGTRSLSGASVDQYFAGINSFIEQSEALAQSLQLLQDAGFVSASSGSSQPLVVYEYVDTPAKVHMAIKQSSWLAGCISGGYKKIKKQGLGKKSEPSSVAYTDFEGGDAKAFPLDLAEAMIKKAPALRDKLLWSHLAATGARISEALTTLLDDIIIDVNNHKNNKILIIDPDTRRNVLRKYLSEDVINELPHKGRSTQDTYPIEPFASMFWRYLDEYNNEEKERSRQRGDIITNRFLYRKLTDGEPCVASYQTLYQRFHGVALEVTGKSYGFHSFRHMYGYYLVNFAPRPDGSCGFNLAQVAQYLGHSNITTTKRYARKDAELLKCALSAMNFERNKDPNFSVAKARIKYLENEIEKLKLQLNIIGNVG